MGLLSLGSIQMMLENIVIFAWMLTTADGVIVGDVTCV